ncbi:MAG: biosynthetic-type acetolactate synthase large subunit, partial [Kiloniellales bacterium]
QVPTHLIGNDAFQEADTTGITRPCTKHNYLVKDVDSLARILHEAFYIARSGRPGPVIVDLPKDVLFAKGAYRGPNNLRKKSYRPRLEAEPARVEQAVELIAGAKRPVLYCGGGIINSGALASERLGQFVKMTRYPCTITLMGLGCFPGTDPQFIGMLGMHGTYEANLAMHHCDVMVAIGARFDDRITGRLSDFSPNSTKIQIDIDPSSINKNVPVDLAVVGDAAHVLKAMIDVWQAKNCRPDQTALDAWWKQIDEWRARDCLRYQKTDKVIKPQYAIQRLYELTKHRDDVYITTEVGQHQMWAAQFYKFVKPNHWMTSGGLGTMGYGLPAAIGAQIAHPDALVIDIAGESSILMNIQEMSTAAQYRLPVKIFIINNQWMGMVRQWQELLHGGRYAESYTASLPDFVKLAQSFGALGLRAVKPAEVDDVIREMIEVDRTVIADIAVDQTENCFPMIPAGAAHNEMLLGPEDEAEPPESEDGMVLV